MKAALFAALLLAAPATAETVAVNGHEVWYEVHGDLATGRTPVLVLHGGMMTIESSFGALIPGLAQDRPVIGVEQQGHGHTADYDGPMSFAAMRADTLAVLDALKVPRAHVVGFSMGGMLGLDLAMSAPERVASLTAISASHQPEGFLPELVRMNREPGFTPPPEVAALLPTPADFAAMSAELAAKNTGGAAAVARTMTETAAFIGSDWGAPDARLAAVTAPTLILIGDRDFIRPEFAVHMARTLPGAWLGILPDTTHLTILARPELPGLIAARIAAAEAP